MLKVLAIPAAALLGATYVLAQPAPSAEAQLQSQLRFLQSALGAVQAQRNNANDEAAKAAAQFAQANAELQQTQARVKALEDELAKAKKATPPVPQNATPVPPHDGTVK